MAIKINCLNRLNKMNKDMKKTKFQYLSLIFTGIFISIVVLSCKKSSIAYFNPSRMFTPTSIAISGGDTTATISWPASLYSAAKNVSYTLEISKDSSFAGTPDLSVVVNTNFRTVTDDTLRDRTKYYIRVKANASGTSGESYWVKDTVGFTLVGVQIFTPIQSSDIIDNKVKLSWTTTPGITEIDLTDPSANVIKVPISDSINTVGEIIAKGLMPNTKYTAEIFAGTRSKGLLTFTTKASQVGNNIVDLRGIADANILNDTLVSGIPNGSVVLLDRGMTYDMPATTYVITQSLTIESGLGFGDPATIALATNLDASGTIDSITFSDLTLAASGASYFMNISNPVTIGKMRIINCTTRGVYNNSFIRMKTSGDKVANFYMNNCIIDSIGIGAKYAVFYASGSSKALFDNMEIDNCTFSDFYYFVRQDGVTTTSLNVNNCTFDNMINQGGYFVNYSTAFPTSFAFTNCIFGKTLDPSSSNGIKSSGGAAFNNCYQTSDCIFSANPLVGPGSYAGTSYDLFVDPDNGNFSFKDAGFAGKSTAGDPRWK